MTLFHNPALTARTGLGSLDGRRRLRPIPDLFNLPEILPYKHWDM